VGGRCGGDALAKRVLTKAMISGEQGKVEETAKKLSSRDAVIEASLLRLSATTAARAAYRAHRMPPKCSTAQKRRLPLSSIGRHERNKPARPRHRDGTGPDVVGIA
jgi:hypothetical protein